jgi:N-acetylneuraminate synthase
MFSKEIKIGHRTIGLNQPTYFIADIAANHDGDLNRAKELIYLAKESGADCAKFQHFLANKIVSDYGFKHLQGSQSHQNKWKKSVYEIYDDYHCKREWNKELIKTCKEVNIEFMTTPYDYDAINEINDYVNAYKIGSGDITWIDFIKDIAKLNKPVLLATGASTLEDVKKAVNELNSLTNDIVLMQCNTNYTADLSNMKYVNLNVLNTYKELYPDVILGLSDHTFGHSAVLGAVTLGARVIEKHFTDDNNRIGPDHKFAMNPKTWKEMVTRTRELEYALGDGIKRIEDNEKDTVIVQRRSIRLNKDKKAGEVINKNDIEFLRPAPQNSYLPFEYDVVINKTLKYDKVTGDCINKGDLNE